MAAEDVSTKALFRDIAVRAGSDVFNVLVNLVTISVLANYLGARDYGIYTQIITTATLLIPMLMLRLNTASVRFFPELADNDVLLKNNIMTIMVVVFAVSSLAALILAGGSPLSTRMIFGNDVSSRIVEVLALYIVLRCLVFLLVDNFRALNLTMQASLYNSIRFVAVLSAILFSMLGGLDVTGIVLSQCCAEFIILLLVALQLFRRNVFGFPFQFSTGRLAPYFRYSIPLVPYSFFLGVNQLSDRYFITHMVGIDAAGIYTFTYTIVTAAFLLTASLSYVIYPYLSRLWQDGEMEEVGRYIEIGQKLFVFFGLPIAFGLYAVYKSLIVQLAGDEFVVGDPVVAWIIAGHFFFGLCSIFGYIIDLSKKTTIYLKILLFTSLVNLLLNWLLIPVFGMQGAAISTAVTYAVQLLALSRMSSSLVPFKVALNYRFLVICFTGSLIMFLLLIQFRPVATIAELVLTILAGVVIYMSVTLPLIWRILLNVFNMISPGVRTYKGHGHD